MRYHSYQAYLASDAWRAIAKAVKERAGWKCQVCKSGHNLAAHHNTYDHLYNEAEHMGDLICLCGSCHSLFHRKPERPPGMAAAKKQEEAVAAWIEPSAKKVTLTAAMIEACRTVRGGFSAATVRAFGLAFPLPKKWHRKLVGTLIAVADYEKAQRGRFILQRR